MLVSSPRCSERSRRGRRSNGGGGIEHGEARPERRETVKFARLRPSRQAAFGEEKEETTAVPTMGSARPRVAGVDGESRSRRRPRVRFPRGRRDREVAGGGSARRRARCGRLPGVKGRARHARATARRRRAACLSPLTTGRRFCRRPLEVSKIFANRSISKEN